MAIERDEHGNVTITGQDIPLYQIFTLRAMLRLEVNSAKAGRSMEASSKGSPFAMLKQLGIIPQNTKTKAKGLEIVNAYLAEQKKNRQEKNNGN